MKNRLDGWGTGTNRIIKECLAHGLPEPLFEEITESLVVTFRKSKIPEELEELGLNERQKVAVDYIKKHGRIANREHRNLCKDVSRRTLARDLLELVRKGLIEKKGEKKGVYYVFK